MKEKTEKEKLDEAWQQGSGAAMEWVNQILDGKIVNKIAPASKSSVLKERLEVLLAKSTVNK